MYYNLNLAWDPKVIGVHNGAYQVELNEKNYDKKTLNHLAPYFTGEITAEQVYPEIDIPFYFRKQKATKETNFMSFSPFLKHCLFIINDRSLEILERFNIQRFKAYQVIVTDNGGKDPNSSYNLFYSVLQDWDVIDFEKTVFTSGGFGNVPSMEHTFKDENAMKSFRELTYVKTLALSKNFDSSLDLFHTRLSGTFVSKRLKDAIEGNQLSGVYFTNKIEVIV